MTEQCVVREQEEEDEEEEEEDGMIWKLMSSSKLQETSSNEIDGVSSDGATHTAACSCLSQKKREKTPVAGTIEKLVEYLAPFKTPVDVSYRTCFLATYRTFISATRLIELLKERLVAMTPLPGDSPQQVTDKKEVQSNVISFLHQWLERYKIDFYSPPARHNLTVLEEISEQWPQLVPLLSAIRKDIGRKTLSLDGDKLLGDIDPSLWVGSGRSKSFSLFSLSVEEFVHCLTAEDKYIFISVILHQCLDYVRSPRSAHAPTIRTAINHFNRVSLVTMATVLRSEGGPEERGRIISRWIEIAQYCRLMKNFSSLLAIVSGLRSGPVYRLRKSWDNVPREKMAQFEELVELFSAADNFNISRDLLYKEGTSKHVESSGSRKRPSSERLIGVIPYLGTFLTDLTMTYTAFPDYIISMSGMEEVKMVNFEKRRKEFHILAQLDLYQKSASFYSLPHNPSLVHWLATCSVSLTPSQCHELSLALEPEQSSQLHPPPSPSHFSTTVTDLSPSHVIRKALKQLFKATVGDTSQFTRCFIPSDNVFLSAVGSEGKSKTLPSSLRQGQSSISTTTTRHHSISSAIRTVRVVLESSEMCLYRTISVSEDNRTGAVIREAMKKHGIEGDPSNYHLQLADHLNHRQCLSQDANIFYALADSSVLILCQNH